MVDRETWNELAVAGTILSPVALRFMGTTDEAVAQLFSQATVDSTVDIQPFGNMNLDVTLENNGNVNILPSIQPTVVTPDQRQLRLEGKLAPNELSPGQSFTATWSNVSEGCRPNDQGLETLFDQEGDYGIVITVWAAAQNAADQCYGQLFSDELLSESFPGVITVDKNESASLVDVSIDGTSIR